MTIPEQEVESISIRKNLLGWQVFKMETLEQNPTVHYDQLLRAEQDVTTWLAEVLDGRMYTEFSYQYDQDKNELFAEDGSPLGKIFNDSVVEAEELQTKNPNLGFELRRRKIEMEEYEAMIAMQQSDFNTLVVVSDFPAELVDAKKDVGGYNVTRQQTMLRVITKQEDGSLRIRSQSLDKSYRPGLEKIYQHLGSEAQEGELLGQRVMLKLDNYQQEFLSDNLTHTYDTELADQYGGSWKAGRLQPDNPMNTYDFVIAQRDIIDYYLARKDDNIDQNGLLFALSAEMERRWNDVSNLDTKQHVTSSISHLESQIIQSAIQAQIEGKEYSGCGVSVGSDAELAALGYGNKTKEELSWHGGKKEKGTCVNCKEEKIVGVKSWCQSCISC